ncbi:phosphate acyltransferase PlsX [Entomomonas asaccharolytica]|uniref:Phosphate acyltransferase n=1 Tax=Entomomonas asaccharolytica TaxID=2785331 RepID=A0A974NDR9_9GAMM|nr:phosphate acyltransferase PlsX [Entomomonas asaccharolytica]QQP84512.1 phosphate acyltransferase PlsX [Entomomonas asaccharolytica]
MTTPVIAVDVMGGDFGPSCTVPACLSYLAQNPSLKLILVGQSAVISPLLPPSSHAVHSQLEIVDATEVVAMDDPVAVALRSKPNSSMRLSLELVRDGKANACVSAGNTGALMALARFTLKTIPGIDRPAMMCCLPTQANKGCYLLDLGANVDCSAEQLFQFAVMGSVAAEVLGVAQPKVALLNIGIENIKGNQQVKQATQLLESQNKLNYIGFVEGDGVYRGDADVVVCDGFVGNVLLKSSEGVLRLLASRLDNRFKANWLGRLKGLIMFLPMLRGLRKDFSPERYNGASFLGLQGVVIKSHGSADSTAFQTALHHAYMEVNEDLQARLSQQISLLLEDVLLQPH